MMEITRDFICPSTDGVKTTFLPAELVRLSVPAVSAQSVWLSALQTAPSFHSPPFFSPPQPEPRASVQSLNVAFAVGTEAEDREMRPRTKINRNHNICWAWSFSLLAQLNKKFMYLHLLCRDVGLLFEFLQGPHQQAKHTPIPDKEDNIYFMIYILISPFVRAIHLHHYSIAGWIFMQMHLCLPFSSMVWSWMRSRRVRSLEVATTDDCNAGWGTRNDQSVF